MHAYMWLRTWSYICFIYISICTCIYMYIHVCLYILEYVYIHIMYACMYVCVQVCMHVLMYSCISVCKCMHVCMFTCVYGCLLRVYICTMLCKNKKKRSWNAKRIVFLFAKCVCHKPSLRLRVTTAVHAILGVANLTCNRITSPHLLAL